MMKISNKKYITLSALKLEEWLPSDAETMIKWLLNHPDHINIEEYEGLVCCLFSFPVLDEDGNEMNDPSVFTESVLERAVLLVYDGDTIVADCSGLHASMYDLLFDRSIFTYISEESDWMYLEDYTMLNTYFPDIPYPAETKDACLVNGQAMLYGNAYVTRTYRRRKIFTVMVQMMRDHALRHEHAEADLYSVIAMDPDVACYGPDALEEPYVYSYEADEPVRLLNGEILKKLGFSPMKLIEETPSEDSDGTKLWFAVQHEKDLIIEQDADIRS